MYGMTIWLHSNLRWVVLVLLALAAVQAFQGWFGQKEWTGTHKKISLFAMIAADIQLAVGLILYMGVSPTVSAALKNMKLTMKTRALRFWAVEHIALMLIALALIHIGFARAKRAKEDTQKFKSVAIFFTLALLAIFAAIPWPFMKQIARPWFR